MEQPFAQWREGLFLLYTMRQTRHHTHRRTIAVAAWLLLSACSGARRAPAAAPAPPPAAPAPAPAAFAYAPGERQAFFESRATVHVAGDTSAVTDTIVTRLHATFYLAPSTPPETAATPGTLRGTVDSVTIDAGSHATVGTGTPPLAAPIPFTGTVEGGTVRLDVPPDATTDCDSPVGAYLTMAGDLLPSLPARLTPGDSWSDTVTSTSCRGGVVLTTTATHHYVVQDTAALHNDRQVTRVGRTTSYRLSGTGAQAGVPVRVAGDGSGEGELLVDVAAGQLLTTTARSTLNMTFEAVGRVQRVVQDGVQRLVMTVPLEL